MSFEDNLSFFPCGVHYHRAPTPLPEEWEGDLKEIARCGYTHVQFRPQWRWHERLRGKPTWDDLDRLFDLAGASGLRVVLKPMLETAPDWVYSELKGTRIGFHGVPISPVAHGAYYVGGWWPCFDNPEVSAAAGAFVRIMAGRYSGHPALWFYDAWNEPRSRPSGQCHCEHSVASYRQWLRERFGTIERLNGFLGKAWTAFETVLPPEAADDYAEMYLWKQWAGHAVAAQVEFVAKAIKAVHPKAFVMMHVGCSMIVQDAIGDVSNDFLNAGKVDRYGTSFGLPMSPQHPLDHAAADRQSDWVRRIDPSYWCHELYCNEHHWSVPPTPAVLRRMVWSAVAGGAAGLTHWQWRSERVGNEVNGAGMREIDGSRTERGDVCDDVADVLKQHGRDLVGARRIAGDVAMLYSHSSDLIFRLQEMNDWWTGIEKEPYRIGPYKQAVHAAHAMHLHAGRTVDWVVPGDDVRAYRLLHVSAAEIIDAATADWLRQYVRGGGRLLVEFPFACRDDNTWVSVRRPNHGLEDLLGCREAMRLQVVPGKPWPATFERGLAVEPDRGWIAFAPTTGSVLATWPDGSAAAVSNRFGQGQVVSLGVNLSWSARKSWSDQAMAVLVDLTGFADATQCESLDRPLWVRRRRGTDYEVWFVFNNYDAARQTVLHAKPLEIWVEGGSTLEDGGRRLTVPGGQTWVAKMPIQA